MKITYDPNKNQRNIDVRGLSFELVEQFDWNTARIWQDTRFDYGETRFNALGFINERLYFLTFKPIDSGVRIISFRKANSREIKHYASN